MQYMLTCYTNCVVHFFPSVTQYGRKCCRIVILKREYLGTMQVASVFDWVETRVFFYTTVWDK